MRKYIFVDKYTCVFYCYPGVLLYYVTSETIKEIWHDVGQEMNVIKGRTIAGY